ncbi:UNKNOWN [Stylonychia lemnae]|uniref:Uncharacterized protein n=1 Tax=Stylonychia lemnae TaxID=5949 RepID=A0A078AJ87_STYLE|nr:UNKNOWN [Stylonychia lemnae]|eukprot:CDW82284.1 UNKNOWN [Stylonychia lemnae]
MFIRVEAVRPQWTNQTYINSLNAGNKLLFYSSMFAIFWNLGILLDQLFRNADVRNIINQLVGRLDDGFTAQLRDNVMNNIQSLYLLAQTAPGASCKSLGIRGGIALRKVISSVKATNNCNISFFGYDQPNWYNISYGFMEGLYNQKLQNCPKCASFATNVQGVNRGYVYIVEVRDTWINKDAILKQSIFIILASLTSIFLMFFDFYINLDRVFQDETIMSIPNTIVTMLSDPLNQPIVQTNFKAKMNTITVLAATIPGADCKSLGYRLGAIVRFIFGVSYPI